MKNYVNFQYDTINIDNDNFLFSYMDLKITVVHFIRVSFGQLFDMDIHSTMCSKSLNEYVQQLENSKNHQTMHKIAKFSRWLFIVTIIVFLGLVIVYNFVFENYEVVGESLECTTNTPFAINYTCKLDIIENHTQYWSFESTIPEDITLPHMMVSSFKKFSLTLFH